MLGWNDLEALEGLAGANSYSVPWQHAVLIAVHDSHEAVRCRFWSHI